MKRKASLLAAVALVGFSATLHAQGVDVGNVVANQFASAIKGFGSQVQAYADRLFWSLAGISLVWTGVTMALRKADLMDFTAVAASIITGLQQAGATVGGANGASQASTILQLAMKFADVATNNITIMQPNMAILWALMALMVLLIGCYVVVTVTIALCQALLLIYAGIFVLGFGGSRWTSEIAIGYYKAVTAAGLKLFTLNLLMNTAVSLVSSYLGVNALDVNTAFICLALLVIVAMLIDKVPAQIASLVSGNHIGAPGSALGTLTGAGSLAAQGAAAVATGGTSLAASGGRAAVKVAAMRAMAAMAK